MVPRFSNVGTRPSKRGIRGRFEGSGRFALRKILGTLLRVAVAPRVVSSWTRSGCRFRRSDVARRATRGVARRDARRTAARSSPRRRATAFCHGVTRRGGRTACFAKSAGDRSRFSPPQHLGVRFVPGFVSDETRRGCVDIELIGVEGQKTAPKGPHTHSTRSAAIVTLNTVSQCSAKWTSPHQRPPLARGRHTVRAWSSARQGT